MTENDSLETTVENDKLATLKNGIIVPNLFKVSEVAKALGISPNTLYTEIKAGRLRARRPLGRKTGYRLSINDVNDWAERTTEVINNG